LSDILSSPVDDQSITVPFPVTHAILSSSALQTEILPRYEVGTVQQCIFLTRGVNDTYLVQTQNKKYILRAYRAGWRTLSDILFEIAVLHHLNRAGILISTPIAQTNGNYVCTLQAPEGIRHLVLFTYAAGMALNRHDVIDAYYHGNAMATMHNALDNFQSNHERQPLDLTQLIDQSLAKIAPLQTCTPQQWSYLLNHAELLRTRVQRFSAQGLNWGVCHGDCHLLNDHIDPHHRITFFDFDCCSFGWRAYELAVVRWCEGFYNMDPGDKLWRSFLSGYTKNRSLSEVELASIPTFVAIREIWHTALIASLQPDSGIQGFANNLQRTIRLLQAWEENS
jgi:Ser/Thr protein kinase RdoA (MazF antagonist)